MQDSFSILELLHSAIIQMTWVEVWAVITGLIYVILVTKENIWCWLFGIISSLLSIYLFYTGKLYAESILYFYYVIAGVYGWYAWNQVQSSTIPFDQEVDKTGSGLQISTWTVDKHVKTIVVGIVLSLVLAFILQQYTDANIPLLDSFTTIFSFIATYMVTRKILENWIYWIIIDIVTMGMYFHRAYYLYALLMIAYTVIAVIGYFKWQRIMPKRLKA